MFATSETVGLAEWIIDDTYLICFLDLLMEPMENGRGQSKVITQNDLRGNGVDEARCFLTETRSSLRQQDEKDDRVKARSIRPTEELTQIGQSGSKRNWRKLKGLKMQKNDKARQKELQEVRG